MQRSVRTSVLPRSARAAARIILSFLVKPANGRSGGAGYSTNNGVFYMLSDHLKSTSALVARTAC